MILVQSIDLPAHLPPALLLQHSFACVPIQTARLLSTTKSFKYLYKICLLVFFYLKVKEPHFCYVIIRSIIL